MVALILRKINLDQTAGIYNNNMDSKRLSRIPLLRDLKYTIFETSRTIE